MRAIIRFFVERHLVINLITIFILALGLVVSIHFIQREAFPNVNLDRIQIDVMYPGASPREVEQLLMTPIEQELRALNGIDKMYSMSFPGSGRINMEVDPDASNRSRLSNEIQLAVARARLPDDLKNEPVVTEVDGAIFPIIRLTISAPLDELQLMRLGDDIKDDLLGIKGVAKVQILGARKAEIRIVVDPKRMAEEHISVRDITQVLQGWNVNMSGGNIDTPKGQQSVRIVGEFTDAKDAANLILRANDRGDVLRLGDVATVTETLEKASSYNEVKGTSAISMIVLKKADGDIIDAVDNIKTYIATVPTRYGKGVEINTYQDFSRFARMRLGVLTSSAMIGLVLVFISQFLFLRLSVALTTSWSMPVVFMAGVILIYAFGLTLNLVSMLGLIIVLGMVVDNATVIGENITWHMERGVTPKEAAVTGTLEVLGPVTSSAVVTAIAFLPMFFVSGVIGKFIVAIPVVVVTLLALSWLESIFFLPSHVAHYTNPDKHPPERAWLVAFDNVYVWCLERFVRFRWTAILLSVLALVGSIMLAKNTLSFQLFPPVGVDEYVVRVTAPPGTSVDLMRDQLRNIDRDMRAEIKPEYLQATLLKSGDVSVDEGDPLTQRGSRYGMIRAIYEPAVSRPDHNALTDMQTLAKVLPQKYPQLDINFSEIRSGPPLGRALEVEISSYDNAAAETAAYRLMDYLKTIPGVTTVDSGLKEGDAELYVVLDRERATYAGVDLASASQHVRAAVGGLVVSNITRGTEEIDVTIRFPQSDTMELKQLRNIQIPNKHDGLVPLYKIAHFEQHTGFTTIRHKDGVRIVNVVADINADEISSLVLNNLVKDNAATWQGDMAEKVKLQYGGEDEKNTESFFSMVLAFGISLVAIFFVLAIQFSNISYPIIVMLAIPFGIIGVIISAWLHNVFGDDMPFSFFSSLGIIALSGVVVNNSLVLLEFVQRAVKEGAEIKDAVIQAGRRRFRSVILTSATTVLGLIPTAFGWGGYDPLIAPMALALSWGLTFSTVITMLTVPAVVVAMDDVKKYTLKLIRRQT